jgi:methionyl-tRNA formyltransferase
MSLKKFKVGFLGNWGTAYEILKILNNLDQIKIEFVITQKRNNQIKDKWHHIVYDYAKKNKIFFYDQENFYKNKKSLLNILKKSNIDLIVSVAYPFLISSEIIDFMNKKFGIVNLHGGLLPKYRGTTPVLWAIINQEKYLGMTLHYIDKGCDSGDIIDQKKVKNLEADTLNDVTEKLKKSAIKIFKNYLNKLLKNKIITRTPQDHSKANYAYRLKEDDLLLDLNKNKDEILAFIKGTKNQKIFIKCNNKKLIISKIKIAKTNSALKPNTIVNRSNVSLKVATKDNDVILKFEKISDYKKFNTGKLLNE